MWRALDCLGSQDHRQPREFIDVSGEANWNGEKCTVTIGYACTNPVDIPHMERELALYRQKWKNIKQWLKERARKAEESHRSPDSPPDRPLPEV